MLISSIIWFFLGCKSNPSPPLSDEEAEISELSDLINNPDNFREKCKKTKSKIVKERCRTLAQRPHLFTENPMESRKNQQQGTEHQKLKLVNYT